MNIHTACGARTASSRTLRVLDHEIKNIANTQRWEDHASLVAKSLPCTLEPSRRAAMSASIAMLTAIAWPAAPFHAGSAEHSTVLKVGRDDLPTIRAALEAAQPGDTIFVPPGKYIERVVIDKPVVLQVDATGIGNAAVEISWETTKPYESTIEILSNNVTVSGFRIRHSSPSIAANYAIKIVDVNATVERCDVSSATGSAVGMEGGASVIRECILHDCKRNGAMIFQDIEGNGGNGVLQACEIYGNGLHGVLVRDGAAPQVIDNRVYGNAGYGLALQGAGGVYDKNQDLGHNRAGAVGCNLLADGLDERTIAEANDLQQSDIKVVAL
jgi:nitrous oxidase accessory protein NosD